MDLTAPPAFADYENGLEYTITKGETDIRFIFEDFARTPFGPRVQVTVGIDKQILERDHINPEKREERVRLANAAYSKIEGLPPELLVKDELSHHLMLACTQLEHAWYTRMLARLGAGAGRPQFLLPQIVIENAGTILFGAPGAGKSWMGLAIAAAVEHGPIENTFPPGGRQGKVLFVNLERSAGSLQDRWRLVKRSLGLAATAELRMLHGRGVPLAYIKSAVQEEIRTQGIDLVIVDSLSRIGAAGTMNDDGVANGSMDILNGFGCAWLALGHTPKSETGHVFGSQMFEAAADLCIRLDAQRHYSRQDALVVRLTTTKANDTPLGPPLYFTYNFDAEGLSSFYSSDQSQWAADEDVPPRY